MNIKTTVKSGNLELVSGGSFLSESDKEVTIILESNVESPLNLIFRFKNDNSNKDKLHRDAKAVNDTTLDITFTNYNSVLGSFNKELWEIGTIAHRKLFMAYVIYGFNDSRIKKIDYTFYLGEEVRNG
jgi:hypothetical protein